MPSPSRNKDAMNNPETVAADVRRRIPTTAALRYFVTPFLALCLAALAGLLITGCKQSGSSAKPADVDYYTCTMHPSVKSQDPKGKCPICSMDLVPVMKKGAPAHDHAAHGGEMPGMPMKADTNAPGA